MEGVARLRGAKPPAEALVEWISCSLTRPAKPVPKKALPQFIAPMMASSAREPFNDPDWIFETKLDGYVVQQR